MVRSTSTWASTGQLAQLTKSLEVARRVRGEGPDTIGISRILGLTFANSGKYPEAERLLTGVLATRERVLGSNRPETDGQLHRASCNQKSRGQAPDRQRRYICYSPRVIRITFGVEFTLELFFI